MKPDTNERYELRPLDHRHSRVNSKAAQGAATSVGAKI
jgi:hypothetical protein